MTLSAVKVLSSHVDFPFLESRSPENLGLDHGLIDQHDGDVVLDRINPVALRTLQTLRVLTVRERLLAGRAHQNFQ